MTIKEQYAKAGIVEIDTVSEMMDACGAIPMPHADHVTPGTCHYCGAPVTTPGPCAWRTFYMDINNPTPCEASDCPGCAECDAGMGFGDYSGNSHGE